MGRGGGELIHFKDAFFYTVNLKLVLSMWWRSDIDDVKCWCDLKNHGGGGGRDSARSSSIVGYVELFDLDLKGWRKFPLPYQNRRGREGGGFGLGLVANNLFFI